MLLFGKLVDETQLGNPRNHAVRDTASKFSIFLPLRAILKKPYHYETPCICTCFRFYTQMRVQKKTKLLPIKLKTVYTTVYLPI